MLPNFPTSLTVKVSIPAFKQLDRYKKERARSFRKANYPYVSPLRSKKVPASTPKRSSKAPASKSKLLRPPVRHVVLTKQEPISDKDLSVSSEKEMSSPYPRERMVNVMPFTEVKRIFHRRDMKKIREIPVTGGKCEVYADCLHGGEAILDKDYTSSFLGRKWAVHMRYQ